MISPEMRSTREVIGFDKYLGSAYAKAEIGAGNDLPSKGNIFISVNDADKKSIIKIARDFTELDFQIIATNGTQKLLNQNGVNCLSIYKVGEGRPNIVDLLKDEQIQIVFNTTEGIQSLEDSKAIRSISIRKKIP